MEIPLSESSRFRLPVCVTSKCVILPELHLPVEYFTVQRFHLLKLDLMLLTHPH